MIVGETKFGGTVVSQPDLWGSLLELSNVFKTRVEMYMNVQPLSSRSIFGVAESLSCSHVTNNIYHELRYRRGFSLVISIGDRIAFTS